MRKTMSFILITMLLVSSLTIAYGNINNTVNKFSDVSKNDWFTPTVAKLVEMGGIQGYDDGTFKPNRTMTQAEFIKTVVATLHDELPLGQGEHWAMNYIRDAEKLGYIDGGEYRDRDLNSAINRYQMAKIIVRAVEARGESFKDNASDYSTLIKDYSKIPNQYQCPVLKAYSHGLLMGYPEDGEFKGTRSLTRAEAATVVIRIFDKSARVTPEEPKPKEGNVEIVEGIEFDRDRDIADRYGKMERSKALEFEMLVHESYDFSDPKKLKGYLPELPEGYKWQLGFTVYYKEGSNVSASNSQAIGHGFDTTNTGNSFELELWGTWEQVERTVFLAGVRRVDNNATDGWSLFDKSKNEISVRDNNGNVLDTIKK
ncbi:S-layer homology domain-containing protein [Alkaliphilus peptidifermentans]|uniref:S-layer homology domain-containing protein n=1 Tax=Alkaliphilus peptidifermentans DSM 18978 TaxID=1120976 RepID=A0A1G5DSS7_9FIRM|nr:S-layer homology domain-containing protein [Alkaliphilus peptidifermentans]SCY17724.1 S-layer homology domain-containing protein [Alkaliphilus peptidifermentans DSM 18978]